MTGHIRRRGERSWELKYDVGSDASGRRKTRYASFKGSKREAAVELAKLIASVSTGAHVEPSKLRVAEFARARVKQWEAAGDITARTAQRYNQLVENQIVPHLGSQLLQKLSRLEIEGWHTALRTSGLAVRTIGHAHRVLSKVLSDAESDGMLVRNVCKQRKPPKVPETEMAIVRDVPAFLSAVIGAGRLYPMAILAIFAGLRLGEVLALREGRLDLDRGVLEVREALEETKAKGIVFKSPKSVAGRRDITLPDVAIEVLREHRRQLLEMRMKIGAGKMPPETFCDSRWTPSPSKYGFL